MRKNLFIKIVLIGLLCISFVACSAAPEPVVEPEVVVEVPVVVEEATLAPEVFEIADLDLAYSVLLENMTAYQTIGLEALNTAMVEDPPFLIDVRKLSELEENGYIPGAIHIPLSELGANLDKLPSFDTPIVTYCGSGWRCIIAATLLSGMGWEDVTCLKGSSFGGWVAAGYAIEEGVPVENASLKVVDISPAAVDYFNIVFTTQIPEGYGGIAAPDFNTVLVESPDVFVIDVRKESELTSKGQVQSDNWVNIPLEEFMTRKSEWPSIDAEIVIYCGSGHRSTIASSILWSYGYTNAKSLKGGFGGWVASGYDFVGGIADLDTAFDIYIDEMVAYNTIGLDALNTMIVEGESLVLVDLRGVSELEGSGHIEGAINAPLRDFAEFLEFMPSFDTTIVTYCGSGWRCTIGMTLLEGLGYEDVLCLKDSSYSGWVEAGYPVIEGVTPEPVVSESAPVFNAVMLRTIDEAAETIPDGWFGITAEAMNTRLVESLDVYILDVRTTTELDEKGIIEATNWANIPLQDFIDQKDLWPADLDAEIIIHCGSGHRSTIAATILHTYGYTNVKSLKNGFNEWVSAGFPVGVFAP